MTQRALITGLNGFTGQYMARELADAGYEVHGLENLAATAAGNRQVDLCDPEAVRQAIRAIKPNIVVHLAAIAFVAHGNADDFYRVNLMGTRNLLAALSEVAEGIDCVLLASSANVYGNRTGGILTEESLPDPANDYAVSKLAMEYMAKLWMDKLPIVIARPFNYTGVGQSENFLIPKIVSHFRRKEQRIELGNLDVWRDFSNVRSVCNAYANLIKMRPVGQTFNVCSGVGTSLREVVSALETLAGYQIELNVNPAFVRANEVKVLTGSAERLNSVIPDWKPITLEETLRWMYSI
ncbi:GDP-6-deoxy-D-lyxo-4-hexulose reductase [Enterobacter roggenkampii]|uniref:Nucleoside-diphosphate-sugar epimerase n=1 Tax=Rahnella aquatilis (strain ATCC 33071 / DSM 4594 / JCM 1683 / NBRC 105701 / NCIMB 13365 / CIP 78.65) TaxID=745277 RepID=H2IUE1_RAHAC|nr:MULTISPECIES: NAD-dependent epimerase/dehydratase family protein [Enterobacterales]AEX50535.1 nucleoside-diphosphate-sugar epimerase [Rahnella aquatilis CIP 78.65 = ATCC 33071]KFD01601.1 UDP-glucose 4-epimerase [Rahnella aquatilis CIP 78.65 = ATCC 33071]NKD22844.1 NAD-dependent epimerase/dehydratase family protein [Enterobacter asburiae]BDS19123.1 GDP-6-deoxy-D-lyxo-4-hexulose reductase [Enterobacter roggenkampii]BDS22409.1 GDP-6-deoxy-D-lyxo-4-hexulose reductase [Enterobacter roggenkampii]